MTSDVQLIERYAEHSRNLFETAFAWSLAVFLLSVRGLADTKSFCCLSLRKSQVFTPRAYGCGAIHCAADDIMRNQTATLSLTGDVLIVGDDYESWIATRPVDDLDVSTCVHRASSLLEFPQP